ncbi:sialate O-acetylesterase [Asticcacaulis solisilvae]|uniref:sialate O-acetylesterase n=1 Tax=Asticcacaulis solisilvae TaxID=1217274 RepID=UPI003FD7E158
MTKRHLCAAISVLALAAAGAHAEDSAPKFARIFGDHAVLQRGMPANVWGTAAPSQAVTVSLNGQSVTATADAKGKWRAALPALKPGGPYTLTATAGNATTTLNDVMVGDVYLCSGQSNMQFPARLSTGAWGEIGGSANSNIRFIKIENDSEPAPLDDLKTAAAWKVAGPDTTGDISAVCYYMSKTLQKEQNVPVGFIDSDWGGTTIQGWISAGALRTLPTYTKGVDMVTAYGASPEKAMAQQGEAEEAWWDAHDATMKAQRAYISPKFNDTAWPGLTPASSWKDTGIADFKDFDGVAWFRTTVTLTDAQAKTANELTLGAIDTYDTTWVNGVRVGGGAMSWLWRDYKVPAGAFKPGANVIVVRVLSGGGGNGGLTGQVQNRAVKTSDGQYIPLNAPWKYKVTTRLKGLSIPPAPWDIPTSFTTLYNGMIAPLAGYSVKLAAWYQGEANTGAGKEYQTLLPLMMNDWRKAWGQPDMPFLVAQLSSYGSVSTQPGPSGWAELREAQALAVKGDPHAALAVTIDVGDRSDIHPTQKNIVAQRLARGARAVAYGEAVTPGGPEATGVTRSGSDLVVSFKDTNGGLRSYSSDTAIGFEVCAGDACKFAVAWPSGDTVVLKGANAPEVTSVRYAWSDAPYVNLYSADDLPAVPFRLDVK